MVNNVLSISKVFSKILIFISLSLLIYILYIHSYIAALRIPILHLDGSFQTASGLFRISHNEVLGKDFFFYLGMGVLYLLYPFFKLAGGDLYASVFISFFSVKVSFVLSIFLLTKYSLNEKFIRTLLFTLLFYILFDLFVSQYYVSVFMEPGNSLKPIRRFVSIVGSVVLVTTCYFPEKFRVWYLGFFAGILATWSNDFGYFSAAFLALYFIYDYFQEYDFVKLIVNISLFSVSSVLVYFLVLFIVTQGHASDWVDFNFKSVGQNQWWYYKPYEDKVFYINELYKLVSSKTTILIVSIVLSIILIPLLFFLAVRKHKISPLALSYIGLVFISGAFISEYLGHLQQSYWEGIYLWLFFAILYFIPTSKLRNLVLNNQFSLLIPLCLIVYFYFSATTWKERAAARPENLIKHGYLYNERFSGYIKPEYSEYIDYFSRLSEGKDTVLLEEYSSLASLVLGKSPSVPFDSVIHALGDSAIDLYIDKWHQKKPNFVTTTAPGFSNWQWWSFNQNWWFYTELFKNYHIKRKFKNQYIWEINKKIIQLKVNDNVECNIVNNNIEITSNFFTGTRLISVFMEYTLNTNKKIIVLMENKIHPKHSYTSINMTKPMNTVSFPLFMSEGKVLIRSSVLPLEKRDSFKIKNCQARLVSSPSAQAYIKNYISR